MKLIISVFFLLTFSQAFAANCAFYEMQAGSRGAAVDELYGTTVDDYNNLFSEKMKNATIKERCDIAKETRLSAVAAEASLLEIKQSFLGVISACVDQDQDLARSALDVTTKEYASATLIDNNLKDFLLNKCKNY